jgi:hypothetical protein
MIRDNNRLKDSKELHRKWAESSWKRRREKVLSAAKDAKERGNTSSYEELMKEYKSLKPDYSYTSKILYGTCEPVNEEISFIPNTCQLHTQDCFQHRRTIINDKK